MRNNLLEFMIVPIFVLFAGIIEVKSMGRMNFFREKISEIRF
jgi:hypothetical protein